MGNQIKKPYILKHNTLQQLIINNNFKLHKLGLKDESIIALK